jgi:hypothetical protein
MMNWIINFLKAVASLPGAALRELSSLIRTMSAHVANLFHHIPDMIERRVGHSSQVPQNGQLHITGAYNEQLKRAASPHSVATCRWAFSVFSFTPFNWLISSR